MEKKLILFLCIIASLLMCFPSISAAWQVTPIIQDTPEQDVLATCPYPIYDELGNKPTFPDDEWITSSWEATALTACTGEPYDNPLIPNVLVTMTNMTNTAWGGYYNGQKTHVYYIADPETTLSNYDGLINSELAFIIDAVGINKPLVSESMTTDGIFEIGETWTFIIQDYSNSLSLAPSAFASLGIGLNSGGDLVSSGSIMANIPEPTTLILLAMGLLGIRRRK
jgi:hypothetical protein